MKAIPVIIENGNLIQVEPARATHLRFHLPGPAGVMMLPVMIKGTRDGTGNWTWNGSVDSPTLKPSVLITSGCHVSGFDSIKDMCWCKHFKDHPDEKPVFHCFRCHTWINEGRAQFLLDCSHELAGKTLDLIEINQPTEG